MAQHSGQLLFNSGPPPWEGRYAPEWSGSYGHTPHHHFQQHHGGYGAPANAAAPTPPNFHVFATSESLVLESPPTSSGSGHGTTYSYSQDEQHPGLQQQQQHWAPMPPGGPPTAVPPPRPSVPPYVQQLEQQNAELARQCRELQEKMQAAAAETAATASEIATRQPQAPADGMPGGVARRGQPPQRSPVRPPFGAGMEGADVVDREELEMMQRRLDAKQREAEAAAAALAAKQQQAAAHKAELEEQRERAAELADQVAHWKDECAQRERELQALQHRLQAAASHAGLLEDGGAALKKKNAELSTALAQRDVTIRQLEDKLRALQGSEGSKERQLEALHNEGEAARRESTALRQQNGTLQAEVQCLQAALAQAREQAASLQTRNSELVAEAAKTAAAVAAAVVASPPAKQYSADSISSGEGSSGRYRTPSPAPQYSQQPQQYCPEASQYASLAALGWPASRPPAVAPPASFPPAMPGQTEQQWALDPQASLQQAPYWQPYQQQQLAEQAALRAGYGSEAPPSHTAFQPIQQHSATATGPAGRYAMHFNEVGRTGSAADASDSCSLSAYAAARPATSPVHWQQREGSTGGAPSVQSSMAGTPIPRHLQHPAQQQRLPPPTASGSSSDGSTSQHRCSGDADAEALSVRVGAMGLGTPHPASSPFATEETLQDMLARTQALEDHLLALNAERNELEAESARMPSHTTGRTLQERKRRAEVERRLDAINREASSVRLQLRRLGVK